MRNYTKTAVTIPTPHRDTLSGRLTVQNNKADTVGIALVCHPGPKGRGMNSSVVKALEECAAEKGYMVLCFNYTGNKRKSLAETEAALRFLWERAMQLRLDPRKLHAFGMGYSYGGARITELAKQYETTKNTRIRIDALLTYEPAICINKETYPTCPSVIMHGMDKAPDSIAARIKKNAPLITTISTKTILASRHKNVHVPFLTPAANEAIDKLRTKKRSIATTQGGGGVKETTKATTYTSLLVKKTRKKDVDCSCKCSIQ